MSVSIILIMAVIKYLVSHARDKYGRSHIPWVHVYSVPSVARHPTSARLAEIITQDWLVKNTIIVALITTLLRNYRCDFFCLKDWLIPYLLVSSWWLEQVGSLDSFDWCFPYFSLQAGKHDAIVKNVHDLLAKLAWDFSAEQLDHLFSCFQVNCYAADSG